ncbi:hypothetical protein ASPVEDRAFT_655881 [Aspergillus versicolor CBS 583.65]|uniref:Uncharacterized protein n=1 Tax=Aspergillus versicolor CBS 583.65 TaxID=1036611 RepID=A0A1L9PKP2_ASPVE|nr:uncharacterized protein ASPVEDRAFT_655881 [Aspergillus versicolor CBS 583.65]OJJ02094.1 hypothetical protein ASPVEDRAFT_655881 [Aspergillus versicolor CBS 583.65]
MTATYLCIAVLSRETVPCFGLPMPSTTDDRREITVRLPSIPWLAEDLEANHLLVKPHQPADERCLEGGEHSWWRHANGWERWTDRMQIYQLKTQQIPAFSVSGAWEPLNECLVSRSFS